MSQSGCSAEGMEPFALRVIGDSMSPEFKDGHIIVVDPGYALLNGVYAVVEDGGEVFFGQYIQEEGKNWLRYLNPEYADLTLSSAFRIKGVVTQRNTHRRRDTKFYDYPQSRME